MINADNDKAKATANMLGQLICEYEFSSYFIARIYTIARLSTVFISFYPDIMVAEQFRQKPHC